MAIKDQDNLKKTRLRLVTAIFILIILIVSGFFIFSPISLENVVLAVSGNYNRGVGDETLLLDHWNYLDEDFLLRDGSNQMAGNLDMGNNLIINAINTDPADSGEAANVQYVDDAVAAAAISGGGDTYIVWGDDMDLGDGTCGAPGTIKLYDGVAFSAPYDTNAGGSNPICIQAGSFGSSYNELYADNLYPLVTGGSTYVPPGVTGNRIVKCAVCHRPTATCYEAYGSSDCNGGNAGFSLMYNGYIMGSYTAPGTDNHYNSTQRACVTDAFDAGISAGGNMGAMWYASKVMSTFGGVPYTTNAFIRCSICCN